MAKIITSKLNYQVDGEWIYIRSVSNVEFEYKELDSRWGIRIMLKGPDSKGPYDQLVKKFETEPFHAFGFKMDLSPVIKVRRIEVGEDWEAGRINVEVRLFPIGGHGTFTQGYFKLYEISPASLRN